MVTTIVLFQGLSASVTQIITLVMGFLVICVGITVLQLSKVDPTQIKLDRRSTLLLQAAKSNTEGMDEKSLSAIEDPGMDALRGSFGTMGSIIRARSARRMSMSSRASTVRSRWSAQPGLPNQQHDSLSGLKRHQLFDNPMPPTAEALEGDDRISVTSHPSGLGSPFTQRKQTIKFDDEDLVHSYHTPGKGDNTATHERRNVHNSSGGSVKYDSVSSGGWSAKAVVGANGEQTPTSGGQVLTMDSRRDPFDSAEPYTAPPALGTGRSAGAFPDTPSPSPYDGLPSTTTSTSFPSASTTSNLIPSGSARSPGVPGSAGPASAPPTSPGSRLRHLQLFGSRSPGGRPYPRGDRDDDREESISLWNRPSTDGLELQDESDPDLPQGGIRLVPNTRNRSDVL